MVNFKLGNEICKENWSTWHERGTKKIDNLRPQQEAIPVAGIHYLSHAHAMLSSILTRYKWQKLVLYISLPLQPS